MTMKRKAKCFSFYQFYFIAFAQQPVSIGSGTFLPNFMGSAEPAEPLVTGLYWLHHPAATDRKWGILSY